MELKFKTLQKLSEILINITYFGKGRSSLSLSLRQRERKKESAVFFFLKILPQNGFQPHF